MEFLTDDQLDDELERAFEAPYIGPNKAPIGEIQTGKAQEEYASCIPLTSPSASLAEASGRTSQLTKTGSDHLTIQRPDIPNYRQKTEGEVVGSTTSSFRNEPGFPFSSRRRLSSEVKDYSGALGSTEHRTGVVSGLQASRLQNSFNSNLEIKIPLQSLNQGAPEKPWVESSELRGSKVLSIEPPLVAVSRAQLSFQFPDWGVNFEKTKAVVSDLRGNTDLGAETAGRLAPATREDCNASRNHLDKGKGWGPEHDPSIPPPICVVHKLPEEVLLSIFRKLDTVRDVCSCALVCKRWEAHLDGDEIWGPLLARQFNEETVPGGGAKVACKRGVMLRSVGGRFQVLRKGFEYLAAALDAWWDGRFSDAAHSYDKATVRRIVGKLTASNWALLYEGFAALFIARADKLALQLLTFLAEAPPMVAPKPQSPPVARRPAQPPSSPGQRPQRIGDSPYPHADIINSPDAAQRTAETAGGVSVSAPGSVSISVPSGSVPLSLPVSVSRPVPVPVRVPVPVHSSGSFSDDLLATVGRGKRRNMGPGQSVRFGSGTGSASGSVRTDRSVPINELVERAECEPEGRGWGRGLRGLAEAGVNADDVAEALAGDGLWGGLSGEGAHRRFGAGPTGAALWREVLRVWGRHRAFVLLVSEQCERLNIEVLRERARAHAAATTPTIFDQGKLCFRGQILLRHRLRRPLQAGLAWLTIRAISADATDDEYGLLKGIRHMMQEIDVSDDATLTKGTFTKAKFRRCFCNV